MQKKLSLIIFLKAEEFIKQKKERLRNISKYKLLVIEINVNNQCVEIKNYYVYINKFICLNKHI